MSRACAMRWMLLAGLVSSIAACDRDARTLRVDTSASPRAPAPPPASASGWVPELGLMLVVPSDSENTALVLYPENPSPRLLSSQSLTLLTTAGDSVAVRVTAPTGESPRCGDAPIVRMRDTLRTTAWAVGLLGRGVSPVRLDSVEALPTADSTQFTAQLARLASALPAASDSQFAGLPFVVLRARRFVASGRDIVIAHLVRRVNQEAAPLEEHTLLIAERPEVGDAPYVVAHSRRSRGVEETAEHFELLSVVRGARTTFALIARDREASTIYDVLERTAEGEWRSRWTRTISC